MVSLTDPPMLGAALDGIVRGRGARSIQWVQDIFPEVAAAVSGRSAVRVLTPWRNRAWRHAYACVAPGHDMAEFLVRQGVPLERVSICQNWAPAGVVPTDDRAWRAEQGLQDKFVVMYSGNLGRVHNFTSIIPLAQRLASAEHIQLVFVGGGAQRGWLEERVTREQLHNVRFLPAQPRSALSAVLSAGDLHLITLRAGCEDLVFPSKLYGISAVGRPVLVIGPGGCEPARIVTEFGFGCGFAAEQIDDIATYILQVARDPELRAKLGAAALSFSAKLGGRDAAVEHWRRVLEGEPHPKASCRHRRGLNTTYRRDRGHVAGEGWSGGAEEER